MSLTEPDRLLHAIVRTSIAGSSRLNVSPPQAHLQVSLVPLEHGASVGPHIHDRPAPPDGSPHFTQEAWIILRGAVRVSLYDERRTLIENAQLSVGDVLVTFHGGHAFHDAHHDTLLLECKNGPYRGPDYTKFDHPGP
jgi:quercetin dioxygenase-like cupin family protein